MCIKNKITTVSLPLLSHLISLSIFLLYTCDVIDFTGCHLVASQSKSFSMKFNPSVIRRLQARYFTYLSSDWPHQYIRLALVKGERVARADQNLKEITRLTLQGQVDEILLKKEPLGGLKDIFHYQNKPCPRLIIIMGGPGK